MKHKLMIIFLSCCALVNAGAEVPSKNYPREQPKGMNGPVKPK